MKITPRFFVRTPDEAMAALAVKKNKGRTWQQIADELGAIINDDISPALLYRVTKGEIQSEKVAVALGIKQPTKEVTWCSVHEEYHSFDCSEKRAISLESDTDYPAYFKCRQDNPEQVRRQIAKYMPGYELVEKER